MSERSSSDDTATPEELLLAAETGSGKGGELASAAEAGGGAFSLALGIMIAALLLAIEYVFPAQVLWQLVTVMAVYSVAVVTLVAWYARRRRASSLAWGRRYSAAFGVSIAFYAAGLAIGATPGLTSPWFWLPYAALTAAPLLLVGIAKPRR